MLSAAISVVSSIHHVAAYSAIAIILVPALIAVWWRDIIREAKGGYHTTQVQRGILIGFLLFLLSEVM